MTYSCSDFADDLFEELHRVAANSVSIAITSAGDLLGATSQANPGRLDGSHTSNDSRRENADSGERATVAVTPLENPTTIRSSSAATESTPGIVAGSIGKAIRLCIDISFSY